MELTERPDAPVQAGSLPASLSEPMWPRPVPALCSQSASTLTAIAVRSLARAVCLFLS